MTQLVWFRNDLRQWDNTALYQAQQTAEPVRAVFIATPQQWRAHHMAPIKQALIEQAVRALSQALAEQGVELDCLVVDDFAAVPQALAHYCQHHGIQGLHGNREYLVNEMARDQAVAARLAIPCHWYHDALLVPPGALLTGQHKPYQVFTPFAKAWKTLIQQGLPQVLPRRKGRAVTPAKVPGFAPELPSHLGQALGQWPHSAEQALARMRRFVIEGAPDYGRQRDFPALEGTSRLSAALSIGLISPRQCLARLLHEHGEGIFDKESGPGAWFNELIWREFYQHVAWHFPQVVKGRAFKAETDQIPWEQDQHKFAAWKAGRTGFPIVDAAMRQLHQTGWMHNRLRMIAASFLVKDLHLDWRLGERHFMEYLIDGDFAANNGGWQWAASTGTDAAPYFRIFNPSSQGQRFDPQGDFIRAFVPELAGLEPKALHRGGELTGPWGYVPPVVDHKAARTRTLALFKAVKDGQ